MSRDFGVYTPREDLPQPEELLRQLAEQGHSFEWRPSPRRSAVLSGELRPAGKDAPGTDQILLGTRTVDREELNDISHSYADALDSELREQLFRSRYAHTLSVPWSQEPGRDSALVDMIGLLAVPAGLVIDMQTNSVQTASDFIASYRAIRH